MADSRDNQTGRMLFTDFDVSDKGRPASLLSGAEIHAFMPSRLPTIADIASSLGLDFEDDGDEPAARPPPSGEKGGGEERPRPSLPERDFPHRADAGDDELELDPGDVLVPPDTAASEPPMTWEDYTRTYRVTPAPDGPEASHTAIAYPDAYSGTPHPEQDTPAMSTADVFDDDDGEIGDILSYLSSLTLEDTSRTGSYPGGRLGVQPPPPSPYGGIERVENWYVPPENAAPPAVPPVQDWYEPPETPAANDEADKNGEDAYTRPTSRMEKAAVGDSDNDTQFVDIFSDIDLDKVWDERVSAARDGHDQERQASGDTGLIDMFDALDLDSLWQNRLREASGKDAQTPAAGTRPEPSKPERRGPPSPDTTQILPAGALFGDPAPGPEEDEAESEAVDLLASLDNFMDEASRERPAAAAVPSKDETVPPPGDKAIRRKREFNLDDLAFENDADEAVDNSVRAPVIDDSLLVGPADSGEEKPRMADAAESPASDAAGSGSAPDGRTEAGVAATGNGNGAELDTAAYEGEIYQVGEERTGAASAVADAAPPVEPAKRKTKRRGLSTEDLLDGLDVDDDAVDHSVSAPVIDDSAIDVPVGPKPGTEEMLAIAEQDDAGDAGQPEDAPVAVDPMDVFANMDDMDFSDDGLDDEMRAMLEEDAEAETENGGGDAETAGEGGEAAWTGVPRGPIGRAAQNASALLRKVVPMSLLERVQRLVAWKENWWFYCDLLALIISTASLAVIISYYVWYRE